MAALRNSDPFVILTVCTGNICRSPVAEQLLRAGLARIPGIAIASSGTRAQIGDSMPPQAEALSIKYGGDPIGHVPRALNERQISDAQLVLGMSREHRREIVSLHPRASRYTFTIREFARLAADITEWDLLDFSGGLLTTAKERLVSAVELVASRRGTVPAADDPTDDDIVDPYRQDDATYALSGAQLVPAVRTSVNTLSLAAATGND